MRNVLPIVALLLLACKPPETETASLAQASSESPASAAATPQLKTFTVTLTGDNVQFTMSLFTDLNLPTEQQVVTGPTTIGAGQTVSYSAVGYNLIGDNGVSQSGVSRMGGTNVASGGPWLVITLYEDGVAVRVSQLSTNGTWDTFPNR